MKKIILILILGLFSANISKAQRINYTINSVWKYQKGDINSSAAEINTADWELINLPHTWNAEDAFDETPGYYRGVGWYVKELSVSSEWEGKRVVLYFEGANQKAEVFINGNEVGIHVGGYTAFSFDISDQINYGEVNTVAVKVDNEHDVDIAPLSADFTFYGGIYRNVRLLVTEPIHFDLANYASDGVFVETPTVNERNASVIIRGSVVNNTTETKNIIVETSIVDKDGNEVANKSSKVEIPSDGKADFTLDELSVQSPKLWSPDSPYLYQTITRIKNDGSTGELIDELIAPLGLRWFGFDSVGGFQLNGKPLKLIGANRHQDFKGMGNALTDEFHYNDYKKMKDIGFNFVRLAHYPQAPEVYRTCDELGLLVWSEIPIVNEITQSEEFRNISLEMQREHIRQTFNHPSIIFYGYMNELFLLMQYNRSLSEADREKIVKATVDLAKELDDLSKEEAPNRYTVMALHSSPLYNESGLADVADVVGWNLYFGWYYQELEDLTNFLAEEHEKYPNRPIIVSEYGPDADARIHAKNPVPWDFSEDYLTKLHASYLKQMMNMPYLAGFAVWNFADFGSERRNDAIPFVNQKGLVDFERKEKDAVGLYRAYFSKDRVVHIASHNYKQRAGNEQSEGAATSSESIKIFSNQETVELIHNGNTLGNKQVADYEVNFEVPFKDGKNILRAVSENGDSDEVTIDYKLIPANLRKTKLKELAINVGAHVSFFDTETHVLWIPDQEYTTNGWGYVGGAPYEASGRQKVTGITNNILGTENNPLFQTFNEGITGYRFDVADGIYKLTLCFQEHITRGSQEGLMYTFSENTAGESPEEAREFGIIINGQEVIGNLNLEKDYGSLRAVTFDFAIRAENGEGVSVDFKPVTGEATLSGIRIASQ